MSFRLRPQTPEDFPRIVEIMRDQVSSPPTVEDLHREREHRFPGTIVHEIAAVTDDGLLIGYGGAMYSPRMRENHFHIWVRVDHPWRGQGVGAALYREAEQFALQQKPKALEASVRDDDPASQAFAERRGFTREHHLFESTLDLGSFDAAPFQEALDRTKAAGIRFTSLADYPQDDATLQRLIDLWNQLGRDVPGGDQFPEFTLEMVKHAIEHSPYWDPRGVIFAVDGDRWAAVSVLHRQPDGGYYHNFTGVHRDYRGRGLALAIKLATVEYARSVGAPFLRTHNHSVNQRMLAVNRKMGYKPEPGIYQLIRPLA